MAAIAAANAGLTPWFSYELETDRAVLHPLSMSKGSTCQPWRTRTGIGSEAGSKQVFFFGVRAGK